MKDRLLPALLILPLVVATTSAQGPLDPPPGGPQPTQKSLQEIWNKMEDLETQLEAAESRVDVFNAPANLVATNDPEFSFVIQAPGSYYLSRNTSAGGFAVPDPAKPSVIKITADDVTLDLNGFELRAIPIILPGSVTADTAVLVEGDNVTVCNGSIRGFATSLNAGVRSGGVFENLRVTGFSGDGLRAGNDATVVDCVLVSADSAGRSGIVAGEGCLVRDCVIRLSQTGSANLSAGVFAYQGAIVRGCRVTLSTPARDGSCFSVADGGLIESCTARLLATAGTRARGFQARNKGSMVRSCTFTSVGPGTHTGFAIASGSVAERCVVHLSFDAETATGFTTWLSDAVYRDCFVRAGNTPNSTGFRVAGGSSRLSDCRVTECAVGFESGDSDLRRCTAEGCGTGFDLSGADTLEACVTRNGSVSQGGVGFNVAVGADGVVLRDCVATDMTTGSGFGFYVAGNRARLTGCHADRNNSNFVVTGNNNRLGRCVAIATASPGGVGFLSSGTNNTVTLCEAKNCATNFSLNASTKGAVFAFDPATATNPFSNINN